METYTTNCQTLLPEAEEAEHFGTDVQKMTAMLMAHSRQDYSSLTRKTGIMMTSVLGYRCPACFALFGEMRLAVNEAVAIAEQARILIHATKPSEHIDEWKQITERWGDAHQKWVLAAANLKNHFATTPKHARLSEAWPSLGHTLAIKRRAGWGSVTV